MIQFHSKQYEAPVTILESDLTQEEFAKRAAEGGLFYCRVRVNDARHNVYASLPSDDLTVKEVE